MVVPEGEPPWLTFWLRVAGVTVLDVFATMAVATWWSVGWAPLGVAAGTFALGVGMTIHPRTRDVGAAIATAPLVGLPLVAAVVVGFLAHVGA